MCPRLIAFTGLRVGRVCLYLEEYLKVALISITFIVLSYYLYAYILILIISCTIDSLRYLILNFYPV